VSHALLTVLVTRNQRARIDECKPPSVRPVTFTKSKSQHSYQQSKQSLRLGSDKSVHTVVSLYGLDCSMTKHLSICWHCKLCDTVAKPVPTIFINDKWR